MSQPRALVLRAPGTNRDGDVSFALDLVGAESRRVLIEEVFADPKLLHESQMLVIPGGFSFADALGAGRLFALELATRLSDDLAAFVDSGKPVIGICNGFQVLVRTGLLPGSGLTAALGQNAPDSISNGRFICDWVRLRPTSTRCVWTAGLVADGTEVECPVAHGEGRFVCDADAMATLEANDQIAFRYVGTNPNGSLAATAGVCDSSGLVLGLMPHPENHILPRQHPLFLRGHRGGTGQGLFAAGVNHAKEL